VLGALGSSVVLGAYLVASVVIPGLNTHDHDAFAAARITEFRNFLRLHIARDGALTVYAVGIDHVIREWRPVPEADDVEESWMAPLHGDARVRM
jgi:hypothetical protein